SPERSSRIRVPPEDRSLIAGPLSTTGLEIDEREQEQPADDPHMLQAGRQFVPELRSAAEPKAMPDQCGRNRKAGEQQRAQPCEQTRGHEASTHELGKDSRSGESRRPWKPITFDLFDARPPMPKLIHSA